MMGADEQPLTIAWVRNNHPDGTVFTNAGRFEVPFTGRGRTRNGDWFLFVRGLNRHRQRDVEIMALTEDDKMVWFGLGVIETAAELNRIWIMLTGERWPGVNEPSF